MDNVEECLQVCGVCRCGEFSQRKGNMLLCLVFARVTVTVEIMLKGECVHVFFTGMEKK